VRLEHAQQPEQRGGGLRGARRRVRAGFGGGERDGFGLAVGACAQPVVGGLHPRRQQPRAHYAAGAAIGAAIGGPIGAVIGGAGNRIIAGKVVQTAQQAFGPAPAWWPAELEQVSPPTEGRLRRRLRRKGSTPT
jgi:hypothetical protein